MPKDDKRKELTQEEIDAQNEKFRTFFSTSVAQHDLTRGRQLILHGRGGGRLLFVLFAVKEFAQQAAGILLFLIAALHLFGHLCHAGAGP